MENNMSMKTVLLEEIPVGGTFKIGRFEFIKFTDEDGKVTAVSKDCIYRSKFGENNDFFKSNILEGLLKDILPEIEHEVGEDNILEFKTDLLSLDGSAKHGSVNSKISIPTFDFYRKHRAIFERYKLNEWWWLATPDSTSEYYNDNWIVCVSPDGCIYYYSNYYIIRGVRPILIFLSSIFVSCEDK